MAMTTSRPRLARRWCSRLAIPVFILIAVLGGTWTRAHTPVVNSRLSDWCVGAKSNAAGGGARAENRAAQLLCGNCSLYAPRACVVDSDCIRPDLVPPPASEPSNGGVCINPGSKSETVWWDDRTDGAVNDLGTVVMTQDATNLYIAAELWVDPDPVSLPFGEIALDFKPDGVSEWHDPNLLMKAPGTCSVSTTRGCTSNADCHFCRISDEPTGGCSITVSKSCFDNTQCPAGETCVHRKRPCGSACDPGIGDVCERGHCSVTVAQTCGVDADCPSGQTCNLANPVQTCVGLGAARNVGLGNFGLPQGKADVMILFDFSKWLVSAGDAVLLMRPRTGADPVDPVNPWVPITGCTPDSVGDNTDCDFPPQVNPGASGGSGGPPGSVEVAIPWSALAGTGFGPGVDFRFTMTIARGTLTLDFKPDGAHEDIMSESVAGLTTNTTNSCPGMGLGTTFCELADGSTDAFLPGNGLVSALTAAKSGGSVMLSWTASCSPRDTTYEVYQGTIGSWYSHTRVTCDTLGSTTWSFSPAAGGVYFIVVPTNGIGSEGSYGKRSGFIQRPASTSACVPISVGTCP